MYNKNKNLQTYAPRKLMKFIPFLLLLFTSTILYSKDYKFDLMDDIFDLNLHQLQHLNVSIVSKSSQSLNSTPAKMTIITKDKIEARGYNNLADVLNDLPGIQVMQFADSGILNQIGIRGIMGTNYFKILQDGIEIDQTNGEIMSVSMQYPLIGIERVEILFGAASVIYGADAMSGVINLVSSNKPQDQFNISIGQDGYYYGYGLKSFPLHDGLLTIKAHYHHDQDYELYKKYPEDYWNSIRNDEFDFQPHISKSASVHYKKNGFDMGVNYRYSSESTLISMNNKNSTSNIFDDNSNLNTEIFGYFARYETQFANNINSTTTFSFDSTELLIDSYFINKYTNYVPKYKYSKSERYFLEETLNKTYDNHDITLGLSYEWFTSIPMTYDLSSQSLEKNYIHGSNDEIEAPIFNEKWNNKAFYLQDQITLNNSFQLSLAARYDNSSSYGSSFNPRLALIYSKNAITQKLIYSQAFLAPSNYHKYKIYGTPLEPNTLGDGNKYQTAVFRVANPDLEPEKSKSIEYNLDIFLGNNDLFNFSAYYTQINNLISIEEKMPEKNNFIPNTTILDPRGATNAASSDIYGFDIAYNSNVYFSGYDMSYFTNYSYINGEIDYEYDFDLPFLSTHTFKAGATLRYDKYRFSPSFRWVSPIKASHYKNGELSRVNGHFIANLFTSYNINKDQKVTLNIENIFDVDYYGVRYNSTSKYKSPQEGRTISMAYKVKF